MNEKFIYSNLFKGIKRNNICRMLAKGEVILMVRLIKNIKLSLANIGYITKLMWKTRKRLVFYSLLFILSTTIAPFVIIIIPKFIIDEITTLQRLDVVIKLAGLMVIVHLIVKNLQIYARNFVSLNSKYMMIPLSIIFNKKNMEMDFEYTEDPVILDEKQKAASMLLNPGTEENAGSIEGYILAVNESIIGVLQLVLSFLLISTFNIYFVFFLFFVSLINTIMGMYLKKMNYKLEFSTAPLQRKWNYLMEIACNFAYGKLIRIFNLGSWIYKRGKDNCNARFKIRCKMIDNTEKYNILMDIVNILRLLITYAYLVIKVINDNMSIGSFTMYLNAISQFTAAFEKLSINTVEIRKNDIGISNYRNFTTKEDLLQKKSTKGIKIKEGNDHIIEFIDVSFRYPRQGKYVLKNISLNIKAGEKLSIVGENGAGKTTFVKLLLRLYDVTDGKILLDGIDICHYSYSEYIKIFSTVFQDFKVYAFTIYENIALSQTKTTTAENLDKILDLGGLLAKKNCLKYGGSTYMSREFEEEGVVLSGGEQQKLALCRALFKNAPIVILDEPTASLSPLAEHEIYSRFNEMVEDKTAIFISHRLSSSAFCDKIALFSDGQIAEYGTHQELMNLNGSYAEMYRLQSKYYVEEGMNAL